MRRDIQDIITDYWNCAYQQGLERRAHDDNAATAQRLESELQARLIQMREALARADEEREAAHRLVEAHTEEISRLAGEVIAAEQERDTLKAECERLRGDVSEEEVSADLMNAIAEALGDAHDCTRVWHAWNVGTMTQDDFVLVAEDWERLREIGAAVISVGTPKEARLRAQLTQAEEARKLCAVQMMGLEKENNGLRSEVAQLRGLQ